MTRTAFLASRMLLLCGLLVASSLYARNLPEFADLVEAQKPTVVNVSILRGEAGNPNAPTQGLDPRQQIPEIFRRFFEDDPLRQNPQPRQQESLGSGFILSDEGYILTNNHVVAGAEKIIVRLYDRRELEAELVGRDERSDLALLKIDAADLPEVKRGDSDRLREGEWVLAIGSPFGFDYSVTAGIISAIGRNLPSENYVPFIQTDVAINPGNSGGPLFNLEGEVIGINSQIYTRSGGFMGLSFAIPINVAMDVVEQLKTKGFVSRGWLGVSIQDVNRDLAESFGLKKPAGALVAEVLADSPAANAGLEAGDIITKFNGASVNLSSDLPHLVGRVKAGTKVPVELVRSGKERTIRVEVGELPEEPERVMAQARPSDQSRSIAGMRVTNLSESMRRGGGVTEGVLVTEIGSGDALNAGLRQGDIITMVDGNKVSDVNSFMAVMQELPAGKSVPVRIVRGGNPVFLPFRLSQN